MWNHINLTEDYNRMARMVANPSSPIPSGVIYTTSLIDSGIVNTIFTPTRISMSATIVEDNNV